MSHATSGVTIECVTCGEPFRIKPSKAAKRKYCSMECRRLGYRECETCDGIYYPRARRQRYCSKQCDAIARGAMSDITIESLLARTEQVGNCRLWTGARKVDGYGTLRYRGKKLSAHRVMYTLVHGPIPEGMLVCHSCDTPPCLNPDHLWLGDHSANAQDMVAKGRHWRQQRAASASAA